MMFSVLRRCIVPQSVLSYGKMNGGGKVYYASGENNARGVVIFFSTKFYGQIENVTRDKNGRWIIISFVLEQENI